MRREGDGHQPQLALEIRNVETNPCRSLAIEPDNAGKQRDDLAALVRQSRDRALGKTVAAAAQHSNGIRTRIDQPAIDVAQFDAELALAEIIFLGCRALEFGQL